MSENVKKLTKTYRDHIETHETFMKDHEKAVTACTRTLAAIEKRIFA
jgi:hypothetical protein